VVDWVIYYDDGSTFSDVDGSPLEAPNKGVVCIADRKQKATMHLHDWYYWHAKLGVWWGSDIHGLLYQLRQDREGYIRSVMTGANVDNGFYQACMARAFEARTC
jgi:hypothetical protein